MLNGPICKNGPVFALGIKNDQKSNKKSKAGKKIVKM